MPRSRQPVEGRSAAELLDELRELTRDVRDDPALRARRLMVLRALEARLVEQARPAS